MPTPLNVNFYHSFYPGTTGISGGSGPGGWDRVRRQQGMKWAPGDRKDQVLPYIGYRASGVVVHKAGLHPWGYPERFTYVPNPMDGTAGPFSVESLGYTPGADRLLNKAYDRFIDQWSPIRGAFAEALAEARELPGAVGTMVRNIKGAARKVERGVLKIARSYRQLRRGNLPGMVRELGVPMKRKHRKAWDRSRKRGRLDQHMRDIARTSSDYWLQYSFGWAPTFDEIFTQVEIMQENWRDSSFFSMHGSAWMPVEHEATHDTGGDYRRKYVGKGKLYAKVGAKLRVLAPEIVRLTDAGVTQLPTALWAVVPFSFVVDWFSNVGQVLSSFTDLWGTEIQDAYYNLYLKGQLTGTFGAAEIAAPGVFRWSIFKQERVKGEYHPTLVRPSILAFGSSLKRTANAVALLIALFIEA